MAGKKDVYKVKPLNENRKNMIAALIEDQDTETADDVWEALKDHPGAAITSMTESETDGHPGYERYERRDKDTYRNGTRRKTVRSSHGDFAIDVPQDRQSRFEPKVLKKRQKDISGIDQQLISLYAGGLTAGRISDRTGDICGFECREGFLSDVADKIRPDTEDRPNRLPDDIGPVMVTDAGHFSVREDNRIKKSAA